MPDASNLPAPERRSPDEPRRPAGLPIASIEPLTAREREALRDLARALRLSAERVDEALETGRVDRGMDACAFAGELGIAAVRAATVLGSGR